MIRRLTLFCLVLTAWVGLGGSARGSVSSNIIRGTYVGKVSCAGSDHFTNSAPARRYRSSPSVSVGFGADQRLERWTYLFLGRHNLVIQSSAASPGRSFTYSAGAHIRRPGRTRVTITSVSKRRGSVELAARLDWSSPSTHYIGAGTYLLTLERAGPESIRYAAIKTVVKLPLTAPSKANPVVRRSEHCVGDLVS